MIDKNAQRARAAQLTADLAAQGLKKPDLPMPVIKKSLAAPASARKSNASVKYDCAGQTLAVGDKVATTVDGQVSRLVVGKITSFAPKKVVVEVPAKPGSREARNGLTTVAITKFPEQLAKLAL
jgi:hypothetical protein